MIGMNFAQANYLKSFAEKHGYTECLIKELEDGSYQFRLYTNGWFHHCNNLQQFINALMPQWRNL